MRLRLTIDPEEQRAIRAIWRVGPKLCGKVVRIATARGNVRTPEAGIAASTWMSPGDGETSLIR